MTVSHQHVAAVLVQTGGERRGEAGPDARDAR
jgi:hypothetical protein